MLKDIFGSLGFVIVGSDILFWAYFFIMDKVSVFESSDFGELRIIVDPKGDVWFVASDVAKSLGYINAKDAVKRHVDDDDSMLLQVSDNQWGVKRSILKTRYIDSIRIINESGLYSLILSSKLESAKRFKKWVTSEVLPSIRKTGEYKTSSGGKGILVPDFSNPADAARAWADQYEAAQRAIAEKSQAEAEKQQALKTIDKRNNFLHNVTTSLVNNYDVICIEDLNVSGMLSNHKLAKAISDTSFSMFRSMLEYKCNWYGKELVVIDRFYPSSKTCSKCGWKKEDLTLSDRVFKCENCGIEIDRDLNAAINIQRVGVDILYNRMQRDEVTNLNEASIME